MHERPAPERSAPACAPNISAAGRRMRRRLGRASLAVVGAALIACIALRAPWYLRALLAIPAMVAALAFLQARRGTCVARAAEGTFEGEDFSKTKVTPEQAALSRRAAAAIVRDTVVIGVACGAVAAVTALVR